MVEKTARPRRVSVASDCTARRHSGVEEPLLVQLDVLAGRATGWTGFAVGVWGRQAGLAKLSGRLTGVLTVWAFTLGQDCMPHRRLGLWPNPWDWRDYSCVVQNLAVKVIGPLWP